MVFIPFAYIDKLRKRTKASSVSHACVKITALGVCVTKVQGVVVGFPKLRAVWVHI